MADVYNHKCNVGGILVNVDEGFGKIAGSNLFQSKNRIFLFFILEIVLIAFLGPIIEIYVVTPLLTMFTEYLIAAFIQFYIVVFIWFSFSYSYNISWKPVLISEAIVILWSALIYIQI